MSAPGLAPNGGDTFSSEKIEEIYARISRSCAAAGVRTEDDEDLAQEIFLSLLRTGDSRVFVAPWLGAVIRNFIASHWRRRYRRDSREVVGVDGTPEPFEDGVESLDRTIFLGQLESKMPEVERRLCLLARLGFGFAQAATLLEIPKGSHAFYKNRIASRLTPGFRSQQRTLTIRGRPAARGAEEAGTGQPGVVPPAWQNQGGMSERSRSSLVSLG